MADIKFKLTTETKINAWGVRLFRIEALVDIEARGVKAGDKGGWVESTHLPSGDARVSGDAWVSGNAEVSGNARVFGDAEVFGNARVFGDAQVSGNAQVSGDARVFGNARVSLKKQYTKGFFLHSSDNTIVPTIIDQSKEQGFDSGDDYKYLLVVGDHEIKDIEEEENTVSFPAAGQIDGDAALPAHEIVLNGVTYVRKPE